MHLYYMHVCSGYFILIKTFICIFQLLNLLFRLVTIPTCKFYSQTCRVGNFLVLPPTNITNPIQSNPISLSLSHCLLFPSGIPKSFFHWLIQLPSKCQLSLPVWPSSKGIQRPPKVTNQATRLSHHWRDGRILIWLWINHDTDINVTYTIFWYFLGIKHMNIY